MWFELNMIMLLFVLVLVGLLVRLLKVISLLISERVVLNREDLRSYECGFEHGSLSRVPFSLRYFILTLVFLLFDLEIVILLFFPFSIFSGSFLLSFVLVIFFIYFLFFGLFYE